MKKLEILTFVFVSFEGKLLQNLGEGVLKHQRVIWPSLKITDNNFKILKELEKSLVAISNAQKRETEHKGDWCESLGHHFPASDYKILLL